MQCFDCTPSASCLAHRELPASGHTRKTPPTAKDLSPESNGNPSGLVGGATRQVTNNQPGYQLEEGDPTVPDPRKKPRIIISFPRGDPENPYNWSKVVEAWHRPSEFPANQA